MSNLSPCSTTQINHGGPSNIDAKDRHNSCIMSNNPSALSSRSIGAAGAHAMTAASSQSSSTMPQLPDTNPLSSPRRMLRAISNRIGSVVAAATSPFRNGCPPIQQVDNSPSTSIDASTITGASSSATSSPETESEQLIRAEAAQDYLQRGDGGNSDEEGDEANEHNDCVNIAARLGLNGDDIDDLDLDVDNNGEQLCSLPGAPHNWLPPQPPATFKGYIPKPQSGAPTTFDDVDNPGGWTDFMFQPKYKTNKYECHLSPTGARVVPASPDGKRIMKGWEFHYDGWNGDDFSRRTYVRGNATAECIKPSDRVGVLDINKLKKFGINSDTMHSPIHWYQLLLPIADPSKSGIEDDGRIPFFTTARQCTNIYAYGEKNWGGGYSHSYDQVTEMDLVRWAGVPVRHGARGGRPMTLHYRWCKSDPDFDESISNAMTLSRWRQIKSVFKINNNMVEPKRGQPGYDPCAKYDLIFKALCHNMNYFTRTADLDFGLDESTWGFMGYMGECGGRLKNKPVSKGVL